MTQVIANWKQQVYIKLTILVNLGKGKDFLKPCNWERILLKLQNNFYKPCKPFTPGGPGRPFSPGGPGGPETPRRPLSEGNPGSPFRPKSIKSYDIILDYQ